MIVLNLSLYSRSRLQNDCEKRIYDRISKIILLSREKKLLLNYYIKILK